MPRLPALLALAIASSRPATAEADDAGAPPPIRCDLLFASGRVVDGTGAPWFQGDVCVRGDRIAAVGRLADAAAARRIDASRLVLAPGFIDMLGQSEYFLLVADRAHTQRITFKMQEDDVRLALAHPWVSLGTDSGARAEDGVLSREKSHPRGWASTARILGKYVRDEKMLRLEEAVRKMTSLPASRMRLLDRGILRPGMAADLVPFDPELVRERSTYADPAHYSAGFPYVAVNGQLVVDEGRITDRRPGRPLRGPGYRGGE